MQLNGARLVYTLKTRIKMRKGYILLALLLVSALAFAQNRQTIDVKDFDEIINRIGGTVYVTQGNKNEVILEGREDDLEEVNVEVRNGELRIESSRRSRWTFWSDNGTKDVDVYVTVKALKAVRVSGSGDIVGQNTIETDDFTAKVSGSGDIEMDLEARTVETGISGSGNIELSGSANSGRLSISGSGKLLAEELTVGDFKVSISGSGRGSITVNGELNVSISGSGSVYYGGNPTGVNSSVSGSGKVRRIN
jgi:hypothetical protein